MANDSGIPAWVKLAFAGVAAAILFTVIFVPISFSYLDFYDYGFNRRHTTGRVNLNRVYTGGRYFLGPDHQ